MESALEKEISIKGTKNFHHPFKLRHQFLKVLLQNFFLQPRVAQSKGFPSSTEQLIIIMIFLSQSVAVPLVSILRLMVCVFRLHL